MGNFRTTILILAMIGPLAVWGALAQAAAPDVHSPWGDDSDVLAPAGAGLQSSPGAPSPASSPSPPSPPSPEDELRAVEAARQSPPSGTPREYDLAPAASTPATSSPLPASASPLPSRAVTPRPPAAAAGSRAPLPVYLYIRERGGQ